MNELFDSIADGLAGPGYAVSDQFLSQIEVDAILKTEQFEQGIASFRKAGIGKKHEQQINEAIRGDYIHWIERQNPPAAVAVYLNRMDTLVRFLNEQLYLSLKDFEVHMTIYPAGSFYKRHLDQFRKDDHRKLSAICYLNDNWQAEHGGQLRMYLDDTTIDISPTAGRLVCFRSDLIEHEVLPATRERLSLTGWILDRYADLKHL